MGSFLNVVVWRLPRNESLVSPPSHCPKCNTRLTWYDNIPVFGWIALRGRCRYCKDSISVRYPIVEAITGGLFVLFYVAYFIYEEGPCWSELDPPSILRHWPVYGLDVFLISALLAASLIDAELFIIPIEIPWLVAFIAFMVHAIADMPNLPGALNASPPVGAMTMGAVAGLILSIFLLRRKVLARSFAEGGPLLEFEKQEIERQKLEALAQGRDATDAPAVEFSPAQIRQEMRKEMLFLMPPLLLGGAWLLLCWKVPPVARLWDSLMAYAAFSGLLGAIWGALVGAFVVWLTRILGSMAFGREAMGMGDVHLLFGIGAVIGAAGATIVFFVAPFVGLAFALYKLFARRGRELPYGPFLSLATAIVLLFYCRIIDYLAPSMQGLTLALRQMFQT